MPGAVPAILVAMALPAAEVQLTWNAPAGCPSESEVLAEVEALTGRSVTGGAPRLVASATVTADPWRARFSARSAAGRSARELVGESCEALAQAAAVIVAIAWSDVRRRPPEPLPERVRTPLPAVLTLAPLRARWPVHLRLGGTAGVHAGIFPEVGVGGSLGLAVTRTWMRGRVAVFGRGSPDQTAEGRTLGYDGFGGRLEACGVLARARFDVEFCGGVEAGPWWVRDRASGRTETNAWLALLAGVGWSHPVGGPWWLVGRAGIGFPLSRPRIQVSLPENPNVDLTIFRPEPVHPRLEFGLAGRFR